MINHHVRLLLGAVLLLRRIRSYVAYAARMVRFPKDFPRPKTPSDAGCTC